LGEGLEDAQGGLGAATAAQRDSEQQSGRRVPGRDLEDLSGLFSGQLRVSIQQPRAVVQRDLDSANWLRLPAHPGVYPVCDAVLRTTSETAAVQLSNFRHLYCAGAAAGQKVLRLNDHDIFEPRRQASI
jgi:hypothetical protein